MEIGNQIKTLRQRRGITQEAMAQHFGITSQAVSKWERGVATPDIAMLPDLSAYFGVTIDELFSLSDETRMERIQNMLWDDRYLNPVDVASAREFLLEKAKREPDQGRPLELLADLENHLARERHNQAAQYAMDALARGGNLLDAHAELVDAMDGKCWDWCYCSHAKLIRFYKAFLTEHPDNWHAHMWLMDQLIDDYRFSEAEAVMESFARIHDSFRVPLYRGVLAWHQGRHAEAHQIWNEAGLTYPEIWNIPSTIGDYLAREGRYAEAVTYQRKAFELAKQPRFVDPLESMAMLYELMGQPENAIAVLKEELEIFKTEWGFSQGETADVVRREIERLEKKMSA